MLLKEYRICMPLSVEEVKPLNLVKQNTKRILQCVSNPNLTLIVPNIVNLF